MTRSICPALAACTPLVPFSTAIGFEFLVQRELLDQRRAQLGIVVHDQDLAAIAHAPASGHACRLCAIARSRAFRRKRASGLRPVAPRRCDRSRTEEDLLRRATARADAPARFIPCSECDAPGPPDARRPAGRAARSSGRAGPGRRTRQQARRGRSHAARALSAAQRLWWRADRHLRPRTTILPVAAASLPIWPGAKTPQTGATIAPSAGRPMKRGPAVAGRSALRFRGRDRPQYAGPASAGRGSAVFLHVARPDRSPTAGLRCARAGRSAAAPASHRPEDPNRDRAMRQSPITSPRAPKIAVPTRTWVAPNAIAMGKSALMPMESRQRPLRRAILAVSAKCGAGASSAGGMHISPAISKPCRSRQVAMKASVSSGSTPDFCGSAPVLISTNSVGFRLCFAISLASAAARLSPVERMDGIEKRDRLFRFVRLQRTDEMQLDAGVSLPHQRWPFCLCFLHAVLAEYALARRNDGLDCLRRRRSSKSPPASQKRDRAQPPQARAICSRTLASAEFKDVAGVAHGRAV